MLWGCATWLATRTAAATCACSSAFAITWSNASAPIGWLGWPKRVMTRGTYQVSAEGFTSSLACFWPGGGAAAPTGAGRRSLRVTAVPRQAVRLIYELRQRRRGYEVAVMKAAMEILGHRADHHLSTLVDRVLTAVDLALWDLAGDALGQPVHRLLGATRDKVPAYASTMCGDDFPAGSRHPRDVRALRASGAASAATPPSSCTPGSRRSPAPERQARLDSRRARGARGGRPGHAADARPVPLLLAARRRSSSAAGWRSSVPTGWKEPMDEHSMSSYVWLCEQLDAPHLRAGDRRGQDDTRAEWIVRGASRHRPRRRVRRRRDHAADEDRPPGRGVSACTWRSTAAASATCTAVRDGHPRRILRARPAPPVHRLRQPPPWLNARFAPLTSSGKLNLDDFPVL